MTDWRRLGPIKYTIPNVYSMPPDVGREVFRQILETPKPDKEALRKCRDRIMRNILEVRQSEIQGNTQTNDRIVANQTTETSEYDGIKRPSEATDKWKFIHQLEN